MSEKESVRRCMQDGALWLTLDRADRANALNPASVRELGRAFSEPGKARVIVLTGAGDRAFCSGADLSGVVPEKAAGDFSDLLGAMDACPVPIIARVNGAVAAGGMGMLCGADIAIGVDTLTLATPEARVGLFPFMILPYLLRVSQPRFVAEMVFAGRRLSAEEAISAGFLTRCVAREDLDREVGRICAAVLSMGPRALSEGRKAFARQVFDGERDQMLMQAFLALWDGEESKEGRAAFQEKRSPQWQEQAE